MRVAPWPPTRYSPPLTPDFPSVFARYRAVFRIAWRQARGYVLEDWQESLLEHVTEINPATGRLRWRQALVSLARQNGKTEIAAALGLLFLLWKVSPYVVGIASSAEQARLVYDRTMRVIQRNPSLAVQFEALTDTRGIRAKDGGRYEIKATKSAALQGLPIDLGLVDEVHLIRQSLWSDLVNGTGGRYDCLVAGITTAGDEHSELLQHLYKLAETGEGGATFGHWIWEAPEARVPSDDAELGEYLKAASPALAAGRIDVATVVGDVRSMPETDVIRYRLNRFVSSSATFIGAGAWAAAAWGEGESFPREVRPVFAIDRTPEWGHATISVAGRVEETIWTQVVASVPQPTIEGLADICVRLAKWSPLTYSVDGYQLRDLGLELKKRGLPVKIASQGDLMNASALLHSKLAQDRLRHRGDPLLSVQMPRTVRKNVGEGYRISRKDSSVEIDAVVATALAVLAAEVEQAQEPALY
ncbi:hypothetical protein H5392_01335 [Tessaracoccus sp. MC1865]|uniref:terminase large subunit domain-containing protein n=1 Tax=Tessaracoccus sp. MC1865 TaxID=2760310 RepID=UPI0015FF336B|nr:terminase large subunit [Tessaracoccus sp. MC1865]MBB1482500.1 hypothetical protein [Tessaracoccus sp. MC1865]QTO38045.1 hypothetical protein J7D54_02755 [Tessaracoccus sp. MC1865]